MSSSTVSCLAADDDSEDTMDFSYEKMKTEPKAKERGRYIHATDLGLYQSI